MSGPKQIIRPYGDTTGDGMVQVSFTLPVPHDKRAEGAALQLAHKIGLSDFGFGHDQEAARILVQAMHDARARDGGELRSVVQQCVGKRAVAVAAARVNDQAGRLVDHQYRLVLVHDRQRQRLRRERGSSGIGQWMHQDMLAAADLAARVRRLACEQYAAGVDPGADPAARVLGQQLCERPIQPHAREVDGYGQRETVAGRCVGVIIHGYVRSRQ